MFSQELTTYPRHSEGIDPNFLDFEKIRHPIPSESPSREAAIRDRKRDIIRRCNYWLFFKHTIRGPHYANPSRYTRIKLQSLDRRQFFHGGPIPEKYFRVNTLPQTFSTQWYTELQEPQLEHNGTNVSPRVDKASTDEIERILTDVQQKWASSDDVKIQKLMQAIDDIPRPERIKKVVCLDFREIRWRFFTKDKMWHLCHPGDHSTVSRHVAALAIAKRLRERTGESVGLYAAGPHYDESNKEALTDLGFTILDPAYHVHEPFTLIDDYTLVFLNSYSKDELNVITEYARPVSIICSAPAQDIPWKWELINRFTKEIEFWNLRNILWYEQDLECDEAPGGSESEISNVPVPGSPCPDIPDRVYHILNNEYTQSTAFLAQEYSDTSLRLVSGNH